LKDFVPWLVGHRADGAQMVRSGKAPLKLPRAITVGPNKIGEMGCLSRGVDLNIRGFIFRTNNPLDPDGAQQLRRGASPPRA